MSLQVMSVVPLEKGKARIRFDDGTEVVLYKGEIRKLGIEEGCVVTERSEEHTSELQSHA